MNVTCGKTWTLLLLGTALLAGAVGCKSAYQDQYVLHMSVAQAEGTWDQASVAVVVLLVHDGDNYRPWDRWQTKAELQKWLSESDADRAKLANEGRCQIYSLKTGGPTLTQRLTLPGEDKLKEAQNAELHAVANLEEADAAACHRKIGLMNSDTADFVLHVSPRSLTLRPAEESDLEEQD